MGTPQRDIPGANPFTGPIVFKAPTVWYAGMRVYGLAESRRFEYDPWWDLRRVPDASDALADAAPAPRFNDVALKWALVPRDATFGPDPIAAEAPALDAVALLGPPDDPVMIERLTSWAAYGRW
jgi:hypothetical protein